MYKYLFGIALVVILITSNVQAQSTIYLPVVPVGEAAKGTPTPTETATATETPTAIPNLLATQLAELQTAVATLQTPAPTATQEPGGTIPQQ